MVSEQEEERGPVHLRTTGRRIAAGRWTDGVIRDEPLLSKVHEGRLLDPASVTTLRAKLQSKLGLGSTGFS